MASASKSMLLLTPDLFFFILLHVGKKHFKKMVKKIGFIYAYICKIEFCKVQSRMMRFFSYQCDTKNKAREKNTFL